MEAHPASFYEAAAARADKYEPRYVPLWKAALALVPDGSSIVELGCGTGRFARYATAAGHAYVGLDFAAGVIDEARKHNPDAGEFRVADLRIDEIPAGDVYVSLEVLEHVDDDMAILARLPRGSKVVMSVPSFHSASHVRHFPDEGSARVRYDAALIIDHEGSVPLPSGAYFHVLAGRIRARQKKVIE